jgi:ATP-dependent Zn protease
MVQLAPRRNAFLGGESGWGGQGGARPFSESTARLVDIEVRRTVEDAHVEARRLLLEGRPLPTEGRAAA